MFVVSVTVIVGIIVVVVVVVILVLRLSTLFLKPPNTTTMKTHQEGIIE